MTITKSLYLAAAKALIRSRETEIFISEKYSEGNFRCPVHLAIGHEAIPASLLTIHDQSRYIFSYHRSHHHFLSSGASISSLILEIGGHPQGCSNGHGGSHHLHNQSTGFMGSTPIIAGTLPVATGFAHGESLAGNTSRTFCFSGDTIGEEGLFSECLNMASLYSLPITFVIENNDLSCFTPSKDRQGFKNYRSYADTFNIPYFSMNGASLESCLGTSIDHLKYTKESNGPCIIHADVFRPYEHCGYLIEDKAGYRDISDSWPKRDPIFNMLSEFEKFGISTQEIDDLMDTEKFQVLSECSSSYNKVSHFVGELRI